MGSLVALFIIVTVSLITVRVGTMALMMTGLSRDAASFQSYSAFFGVGFTTREAELVVSHPVRRRIIRDLILVGNIGLTSVLATLVVTFVSKDGVDEVLQTILLILAGVILFIIFTKVEWVRRPVDWTIRRTLESAGVVQALDYEMILRVESGYCVSEIDVLPDNPLANKTLAESRPSDEGIIILGIIDRAGTFHGAPGPSDRVEVGDVLTLYGEQKTIRRLFHTEHRSGQDPSREGGESGTANTKGEGTHATPPHDLDSAGQKT